MTRWATAMFAALPGTEPNLTSSHMASAMGAPLPALPGYAICLHGANAGADRAVFAMADFIRSGLSPRRRAA